MGAAHVLSAIATYCRYQQGPYYTLALVRTLPNDSERRLVMKSTKTAYYGSGNIERLNVIDWLK